MSDQNSGKKEYQSELYMEFEKIQYINKLQIVLDQYLKGEIDFDQLMKKGAEVKNAKKQI